MEGFGAVAAQRRARLRQRIEPEFTRDGARDKFGFGKINFLILACLLIQGGTIRDFRLTMLTWLGVALAVASAFGPVAAAVEVSSILAPAWLI